MTIASRLMFYVECDHDGCDAVCPPRNHEVVAWESYSSAEDCALHSGWTKRNTLHFCPLHDPKDGAS